MDSPPENVMPPCVALNGSVDIPGVHEADIAGFEGGEAVTSVESDWGFKAGKAAHQSL